MRTDWLGSRRLQPNDRDSQRNEGDIQLTRDYPSERDIAERDGSVLFNTRKKVWMMRLKKFLLQTSDYLYLNT